MSKPKNYDEMLVHLRKCGATYLTTSLAQTVKQLEQIRPGAKANSSHSDAHATLKPMRSTLVAGVEYAS
jgi:hypothetical protein